MQPHCTGQQAAHLNRRKRAILRSLSRAEETYFPIRSERVSRIATCIVTRLCTIDTYITYEFNVQRNVTAGAWLCLVGFGLDVLNAEKGLVMAGDYSSHSVVL